MHVEERAEIGNANGNWSGNRNRNGNGDGNGDGDGDGNGDGDGDGDGNGNGNGNGNGDGNGNGNGGGRGIGVRAGGGDEIATMQVPAPRVSRARPARLLHPSREADVIDDSDLFTARVTVDEAGDVIAVRMLATHPGSRGDQAASAIWQFRYAPALDDDGRAIRSTFEQPFQIR